MDAPPHDSKQVREKNTDFIVLEKGEFLGGRLGSQFELGDCVGGKRGCQWTPPPPKRSTKRILTSLSLIWGISRGER